MMLIRKKRFLSFDTETTGMSPDKGDRIVEIGLVEMQDFQIRRRKHYYLNPGDRRVPPEAFRVHGISNGFLRHCPTFEDIVDDLLDFIDEDTLVAHNASFDMRFINAELVRAGHGAIPTVPAAGRVLDTLKIARALFPGAPASLDALCRRFRIDNRDRGVHGALLDANLLCEVFVELVIEEQKQSAMTNLSTMASAGDDLDLSPPAVYQRAPRVVSPSAEAIEAHKKFVSSIKGQAWYASAP
jgi:DNA polymerase-3 subunit epsilon